MNGLFLIASGCRRTSAAKRLHALTCCVICAAASTTALAINKCKTPDGKVLYQDASCEGGEKVNLSGAGQPDAASPATAHLRKEAKRLERDERVADAVSRSRVFIGMTEDEVRHSWGAPTKINRSVRASGTSEQWVYDRGNFRAQYVYVDDGVVTSVQTQE